MKNDITCNSCALPLKGKQSVYCSIKCKNKFHQSYEAQKSRGLRRKIEIFYKAGGKCSQCQYKKNLAALSFHHLDPQMKEFKLDMEVSFKSKA